MVFAVVVVSYLWMIRQHGRVFLLNVIVHENGHDTFAKTVLAVSHFCREWPVKLVYLLSAWILFRPVLGAPADRRPAQRRRRTVAALALFGAAASIAVWAFLAAADNTGVETALADLLQWRTRDGASPDWGSHWRFHLLSGVSFVAGAGFIAAVASAPRRGDGGPRREPPGLRRAILAAIPFLAATFFFVPRLDVLTDPRFLGHQFREATGFDLLVALPLVAGLWLLLDSRLADSDSLPRSLGSSAKEVRRAAGWAIATTVPVLVMALLLLGVDFGEQMDRLPGATGWSLPDLYAWHVFEHFLDIAFLVPVAAALYLLSGGAATERPGSPESLQASVR